MWVLTNILVTEVVSKINAPPKKKGIAYTKSQIYIKKCVYNPSTTL